MVHAHSDANQSEGIRYIAEPIRRVFRKQDPIEAIVRSFNTVPYPLQHMDSLINTRMLVWVYSVPRQPA